ncbi:MAG: NAD(P)H-dependent oxidoreductase [Spirochaetaceae bacterium]|jgi:chromate reductase|nr:NAD(P)H-dependent oxidoreductase [Spirochaetaceae bacterium]
MKKITIGILIGSLRKDSFCRKVAGILPAYMPENFRMLPLEIGDLGLYNQDLDDAGCPPSAWRAFREQVAEMDGFVFITPEYNRSTSGALKNALDVGSRPAGENRWNGKPGAIISVTIGKLGGFGGYHAVRQILGFLNVHLLQQPEMYLSGGAELFNDKNELTNPGTQKFFEDFARAFTKWIIRHTTN